MPCATTPALWCSQSTLQLCFPPLTSPLTPRPPPSPQKPAQNESLIPVLRFAAVAQDICRPSCSLLYIRQPPRKKNSRYVKEKTPLNPPPPSAEAPTQREPELSAAIRGGGASVPAPDHRMVGCGAAASLQPPAARRAAQRSGSPFSIDHHSHLGKVTESVPC